MTDLPSTITEAARLLRRGELCSVELTEAALAQADRLDPLLGIFVTRFDDDAVAAARRADRELARGVDRGPLHGVPVGVKDIFAAREGPTTAQSPVLDPAWGRGKDATAVARLRDAGAVLVGKTTTMEFAAGVPDPSHPFPVPRNPWDPDRWSGGSSSGSATGVAVRCFLGALGSDTGGSIRIPSACCGVTGLMPTFGRVPKSGCVPTAWSHDHVGPIASTVADCGLLLEVLAGHDPSDPDSANAPPPQLATAGATSLDGVRIGVVRDDHFPEGHDPALGPAFDEAVRVLERLGATVSVEALPHRALLVAAMLVGVLGESFAFHRPLMASRWDDYGVATRLTIAPGAFVSAADFAQSQRVRRVARRSLADLFSRVDALVMPTLSIAAPSYAELDRFEELMGHVHCGYWDATGNPVLAVPMGANADGLPLSLQVAGRPFDEATLVAIGTAFQGVTDWHRRVPPSADRSLPLPSAAALAGPAPRPVDPPGPVGDAARSAVAFHLGRARLAVPERDLESLAARYEGVVGLIDTLWAVDQGDCVPDLRFTAAPE